ncbi:MAG: hypothetical protein NXI31_10810 [bacterium]|nr:hypothetical protein [bacterium]
MKKAAKKRPAAKKPATTKRKAAATRSRRPSVPRFTDRAPAAVTEEIVRWLEDGKLLEDYCAQVGKPSKRTVHNWRRKDAEFAERFAVAREVWTDTLLERCIRIAETPEVGEVVTEELEPVAVDDGAKGRRAAKKGGRSVIRTKVVREDMLGHRRLQIHTLLQVVDRYRARKVDVGISGGVTLEAMISASWDEGSNVEDSSPSAS